jgi:hypothetical protein
MRALHRTLVAVAAALTLMLGLTACTSGGAYYQEAIPKALRATQLGVTDAWADEGLDGFTKYLAVGAQLDRDEVTADDVRVILGAIAESNDLKADELHLTVKNVDGDYADMPAIAAELGTPVRPSADGYDLIVPMDKIASLGRTEQGT